MDLVLSKMTLQISHKLLSEATGTRLFFSPHCYSPGNRNTVR